MVHLYEHPLSPFAQKVKIALYEKSVPFQASVPNLFGGTDAAFLETSPRHEVPSLVDGDLAVFDSTIILEYIEDRWPTPPLLPKAPADRARARMIEELCDTYYEAINWGLAEIRVFGRATGALADEMIARAGAQTQGVFQWLTRHLGQGEFFGGQTFGWADLSVYPYVSTSVVMGFAPPAGGTLARWLERVGQRESVQRCAAAAMEAFAGFQNLGAVVESGMIQREYRDHRLEWMMRSGGTQIVLDGIAKKNIRLSVEIA